MEQHELIKLFYDEFEATLTNIEQTLIRIEEDAPVTQEITSLLRFFHTIKGNCYAANFQNAALVAHKIEDYLTSLISVSETISLHKDGGIKSMLQPIYKVVDLYQNRKVSLQLVNDEHIKTIEEAIKLSNIEEILAEKKMEVVGEDEEHKFKNDERLGELINLSILLSKNCSFPSARIMVILKRCREWGEVCDIYPPEEYLLKNKYRNFRVSLQTQISFADCITNLRSIPDVEEVRLSDRSIAKNIASSRMFVESNDINRLTSLISESIIERNHIASLAENLRNSDLDTRLIKLDYLLEEMYEDLLKIRLVSIKNVFDQYYRHARELANIEGKQIRFEISGSDTLIDQTHRESLSTPLLHLITNAIIHGIEMPHERVLRGKSAEGHLTLHAYGQKDNVIIRVEDDGRGIDEEDVRDKARRIGILNERNLNASLLDILSHPGFSTKEEVGQFAGRGIGLNAVIDEIKKMDGVIDMQTEKDKFTRFIITFPLTIALIRALIVKIGNQEFAVPITHLQRVRFIRKQDIVFIDEGGYRSYISGLVYLMCIDAKHFLNIPSVERGKGYSADEQCLLMFTAGEREFGVIVDNVIDERKIYIMKIDHFFNNFPGVSSGTIKDNGLPLLVLDVLDLDALQLVYKKGALSPFASLSE